MARCCDSIAAIPPFPQPAQHSPPPKRCAFGTFTYTLSAPKSRDALRLRRRFLPLPKTSHDFFEAPKHRAISSAKKIASEPRFLLRRNWVKMVLAAEFPAIPSSAVKIASERRCAILVHSAYTDIFMRDPILQHIARRLCDAPLKISTNCLAIPPLKRSRI